MPVRYRYTSRRAYWAAAAVSVVALVAAVLLLTHRDDDDAGSDPSANTPDYPAQRETGREHDQQERDRRKRRADKAGSEREEDAPSLLTGAPGDIPTLSEGPHRAVLTVTSASGGMVGVKYAFRTGSTYRDGRATADGSWRAEATVSGSAPVALVIGQVVSGTVTCTASVDGRVVSTRSNSGSFATVVCGA